MAKPRRGYLFELDARVLLEGTKRHRIGDDAFYGLQLATIMRIEKRSVYKSLRRLTELGLLDRWWENQDIATASGRPRRRLYAVNQHGRDAFPHGLAGRRALGRTSPKDSNSVSRPARRDVRLRPRPRRTRRPGRSHP
jgi:DNA-binding PadR family transcriptional regulator